MIRATRRWLLRWANRLTAQTDYEQAVGVRGMAGGILACVALAVLPPMVLGSLDGVFNASRFAGVFLFLTLLGRLVQRVLERRTGSHACPLGPDPILDFVVGLLLATVGLYVYSFWVKRIIHATQPIPELFPLLLLVSFTLMFGLAGDRGAQRPARRLFSVRDLTIAAAFLATVSWLVEPHWSTLYGYSTDVDQHIGFLNAIRRTGFVPDLHPQTDLWMQYPLGFHTIGYAMSSLGSLEPATIINVLPGLASAVVLYVVVMGSTRLSLPSTWSAFRTDIVTFGIYVVVAVTFDSSQFGVWQLHEGTGRLATGLVHVVPIAILFVNLRDTSLLGGSGGDVPRQHAAWHLFAVILSTGLIVLVNPTHLLMHAMLSLLALLWEPEWRLRLHDPVVWRRGLGAVVLGCSVVVVLLATDPYTVRKIASRTSMLTIDDEHIRHREADFLQRYTGSSCLSPRCIAAAVSPKLVIAMMSPAGNLTLGPLAVLVNGRRTSVEQPAFDEPTPYGTLEGWAFPDLSGWPINAETRADLRRMGWESLAPIRGVAPWVLAVVPAAFALLVRSRRLWLALLAFLAWGGLDYTIRVLLASVIDTRDGWLRLLPPYAYQASAVFVNQLIWPFLIVAVASSILRLRHRSRPWLVAGCGLALGVTLVSSVAVTRRAFQRLEQPGRAIRLADLRDLRALEQRSMPAEDSYLVSSTSAFSNEEKLIVPTDDSTPLYIQSSRGSLFLYSLSLGSRYSASDLDAMCGGSSGQGPNLDIVLRNRARWVAVRSADDTPPHDALRDRRLCGRTFADLFPNAAEVDRQGAITLFRLW